jgi:hypothetical protein
MNMSPMGGVERLENANMASGCNLNFAATHTASIVLNP